MKIQISEIRPHPSNPRSFLRQDFVDVTSKSMDKDGLKNPVRLVLLTGERQAADGLIAQGVKYYILSGHYRYEAAKKLGWKEIEADVKDNLTPEQEMMELILGNKGQPVFWLDDYRSVEYMRSICPDLTQQELADRLEERQQRISDALRVLPLLNGVAREEIYRLSVKSDGWQVPEQAVLALCGLAIGQPEDVDNIERAVRVLIAGKMTEKQAKKLAKWVKQGNTPESFGEGGKTHPSPPAGEGLGEGGSSAGSGQDGPYAKQWQELKDTGYFQIKRPPKGGIHIIIPDEDSSMAAALGAAGAIWWLGHPSTGSGLKALEGNPYLEDLPELIKKIQGSTRNVQPAYASASAKATADKQVSAGEPETRNQKLETLNQVLGGMINQEPKSTVAKITKAVLMKIWDIVKNRFFKQ